MSGLTSDISAMRVLVETDHLTNQSVIIELLLVSSDKLVNVGVREVGEGWKAVQWGEGWICNY